MFFLHWEIVFSTTSNSDLWMSKGAYDVFALVINFLSIDWQPKHVTIGLFKAIEIIGQTLARSLTQFLDKYGFKIRSLLMSKMRGQISMQ
jgi:hypothetical protein